MSNSYAHTLLRAAYGPAAAFRDGQLEAIESALFDGQRALVVQRTGWGKSVVYFLATRILRERGFGPTLLISPLLALMRNQIHTAKAFGVRAISINSTNRDKWDEFEHQIRSDEVDLLLVAPERLANAGYASRLLPYLEARVGLLVIDEAHCISDWGHDFRPDYRRILRTVNRLPASTRVLGTTATANDRVIEDIRRQFGDRLDVRRGPLMRGNLEIEVHEMADQAERLAWLAQELPRVEGSGIVYTLTVNDARRVSEWLSIRGIDAHAYHADCSNEERIDLEDRFLRNEIKCLVATTALGMGYDKSDVAFVIHFQRPGSVINYYQQIGRAGRNLDRARAVLLTGAEDDEISSYFINTAFPGPHCFQEVLEAIRTHPKNTLDSIIAATNQARGQVEKVLKLLDVEEVISRNLEGWHLVRSDWQFESLRSEQITQQRRRELDQMREFVSHSGCRMEFLARSLDDPGPQACGRCDRCAPRVTSHPPRELVVDAVEFLRGDHPKIPHKKFYPAGVEGEGRKKIPPERCLSDGFSLCVYNDAGWGRLVRDGKYRAHAFSDDLVRASADLIVMKDIRPAWVAWVPSLRRPQLVGSFARRLAEALGIDAVGAVRKVVDNPEQKAMQNSTRQFLNIQRAFEVDDPLIRAGTCLLVDDVVDSGWTLTAIGIRLREAGCNAVVPFTLAVAKAKE